MAFRLASLGPQSKLGTIGAQPAYESWVWQDAAAPLTGAPVLLLANSFQDGVAIVLPSSIGALTNNSVVGGLIANPQASVAGAIDCVVHGLHANARVTLATRSASTAAFASFGAIALGDQLVVETVNNGLSRSTSGGIGAFNAAFQAFQPFASGTTQSSNYSGGTASAIATVATNSVGTMTTATASYTYNILVGPAGIFALGKVFVRLM